MFLDERLTVINSEHLKKFQELEVQYGQASYNLKSDLDQMRGHNSELQSQIQKLSKKYKESNEMLKTSKDTMSMMVQKENELMKALELKVKEFKEHDDK